MSENPLIEIYSELSAIILPSMKKFIKFENIIEHIVLIIKFSMRSLEHNFASYLPDFLKTVTEEYAKCPLSTLLYCAEFTASVYGKDSMYHPLLQPLFDELGQKTIHFLSHNDYNAYPNIIEDFFGMCLRYLKYCPQIIFSSTILDQVLHFSINIIGFAHISASKALFLFLSNLFSYFKHKTEKSTLNEKEIETLDFIFSNGPCLCDKLIKFLESAPHRDVIDFAFDVIIVMISSLPTKSVEWFCNSIQLVSPDCLTREEKQTFCEVIACRQKHLIIDKMNNLIRRGNNKAKRNRQVQLFKFIN